MQRRMRRAGFFFRARLAAAVLGTLALLLAACASDVAAEPLGGAIVEFVVPYDPGGGYDQYVRLIAPYLEECLGTDVVPINEPGAGGLLATSKTAVAEPDGTRIQILNTPSVITAQIAELEGVNYDLAAFSWLAGIVSEPSVLSVAADSEFRDFQELIDSEEPVRFVATGPGTSDYLEASVLSAVYGFPVEIITGFAGSGEAQLAVIQGDADAHVLSLGSTLPALQSGDMRALLGIGDLGDALADVPTLDDYTPQDEAQKPVLDALVSLGQTPRSVAGPPGLPEAVLVTLREGFRCALGNEELRARAEESGRPIDPLTGEEMAGVVQDALNSPPEFQQLVQRSLSAANR